MMRRIFPRIARITSELYGGGPYMRLMQELVLGIGGWRLLAALGIEPEVCHLNEGHAAFAVLERARSFMQATGRSFEVALAVTRAGQPVHHAHARWRPVLTVFPDSDRTHLGGYPARIVWHLLPI